MRSRHLLPALVFIEGTSAYHESVLVTQSKVTDGVVFSNGTPRLHGRLSVRDLNDGSSNLLRRGKGDKDRGRRSSSTTSAKGSSGQSSSRGGSGGFKSHRLSILDTQIGISPPRSRSPTNLNPLGPQWDDPSGSPPLSPAQSISGILDSHTSISPQSRTSSPSPNRRQNPGAGFPPWSHNNPLYSTSSFNIEDARRLASSHMSTMKFAESRDHGKPPRPRPSVTDTRDSGRLVSTNMSPIKFEDPKGSQKPPRHPSAVTDTRDASRLMSTNKSPIKFDDPKDNQRPPRPRPGLTDTRDASRSLMSTNKSPIRFEDPRDQLASRSKSPFGRETRDTRRTLFSTHDSPVKFPDSHGGHFDATRSGNIGLFGETPPRNPSPRAGSPPRFQYQRPDLSDAPSNSPGSPPKDIDSIVSSMGRARVSQAPDIHSPSNFQTPARPISLGRQGYDEQVPGGQEYSPVSIGWSPQSSYSTPAKPVKLTGIDFASKGEPSAMSPVPLGYKTPSPPRKGRDQLPP